MDLAHAERRGGAFGGADGVRRGGGEAADRKQAAVQGHAEQGGAGGVVPRGPDRVGYGFAGRRQDGEIGHERGGAEEQGLERVGGDRVE
jgi:hypothetical protein